MAKTTSKITLPIVLNEIRSKDLKRFGQVIPGDAKKGHKAEIMPGKSIVLFGDAEHSTWESGTPRTVTTPYRREFKIGDTAEYDSYNLSYLGTITSITEKTVTIEERHGSQVTVRRLSLYEFDWRNWDLDLDKTIEQNFETMQVI